MIYTCYGQVLSESAVVERICCWPWVNTVSTNIWPGSKHKQEATAGVIVQMLKAFYQEHIIVCK